jgi:hypothetical protein
MKKFLVGLFMALFLTTNAFATVSNQTNKVFATANGTLKTFSFSFKIFTASDLQVYLVDTLGAIYGPLTLTTDYAVTISTSSEGGSITFVTAPTVNWQVFIRRIEPYTQGLAISTEGPLPSKQIENQLDLAMMTIIQNEEAISRCIQYPIQSQLGTLNFPAPVANLAVGWDPTGTFLTNVSISGATGPQGAAGATGPQGPAGPASTVAGPQGPAGPAGNGSGNVVGPATNPDGGIPQWDGVDSLTLKAGLVVGTSASNLVQLNASAQLPAVSAALLTNFPTLNQSTSGTAAGLSGTPALPNGTTATTQSQADASTKVATTAYVDTGLGGKLATAGTAADSSKLGGYTLGTGGNQILQLDAYAKIPAVDGSQLTNVAGVPAGVIAMWHGSIATIPNGWALCNGSNGTPDLRNRFIVGADADVSSVAKSTVTGSALQTSDGVMPAHTHQELFQTAYDGELVVAYKDMARSQGSFVAAPKASVINLSDHNADGECITGSTGTGTTNIAVFYALAYIMKL